MYQPRSGVRLAKSAPRLTQAVMGKQENFRLLLVGKTGSGKSTTGNTIFGEKLFESDISFGSVTSECQLRCSDKGGRVVEIMDSPGLYDTGRTQDKICTVIVQAVACMHPGPHAVLFVVKLGRFTAEEYGAYTRLKALFDDNITKYMIILFTGGDELERQNKTFADLLQNAPKDLKQVLDDCRHVVFNNLAKDTRPQVESLLNTVRRMKRQNGKPYVCPKYKKIGEGLEEEVARRLEDVNKKDLARQKYVQDLEKKAKAAEEELNKQKKEMEMRNRERERERRGAERRREEELEELIQRMQEQKISEEQRQWKEKKERERVEKERMEYLQEVERQRQCDRQEMARRQAKRDRLQAQRKWEQEEEKQRRQRQYELEMRAMKERIAEKKEPGFFAKIGDFFKGLFSW